MTSDSKWLSVSSDFLHTAVQHRKALGECGYAVLLAMLADAEGQIRITQATLRERLKTPPPLVAVIRPTPASLIETSLDKSDDILFVVATIALAYGVIRCAPTLLAHTTPMFSR